MHTDTHTHTHLYTHTHTHTHMHTLTHTRTFYDAKTCQNNRLYSPVKQRKQTAALSSLTENEAGEFVCTKPVKRKCLQCEFRRVLDHYFNVRFGVSRLRKRTRPNLLLILTGRVQQAVKFCFNVTFVFTSGWRALLTAHYVRR